MARKQEIDFELPKLDDLFTTQQERDEAKLKKIHDIPLDQIDDFPSHPFKVMDDEEMLKLVESIREYGVITPAIVRKKEEGKYEMISGHRRKRACALAGIETLRAEVVEMSRDEAIIFMAVSYTHLDVYKRQPMIRMMPPLRSWAERLHPPMSADKP